MDARRQHWNQLTSRRCSDGRHGSRTDEYGTTVRDGHVRNGTTCNANGNVPIDSAYGHGYGRNGHAAANDAATHDATANDAATDDAAANDAITANDVVADAAAHDAAITHDATAVAATIPTAAATIPTAAAATIPTAVAKHDAATSTYGTAAAYATTEPVPTSPTAKHVWLATVIRL